jgi:SAM-dependent methyltransferase
VGLEALFEGGVVQLDDEPAAWHAAYRHWLDEAEDQVIAEMIWRNLAQMYSYHTFDYKVFCILRHLGVAVGRPEMIQPPVHRDRAQLLGARKTAGRRRLSSRMRSLDASRLKYWNGEDPAPTATRAAPAPGRISLDLGCGAVKQEGFIGADRFPLRGVDVILDLEAPLPVATDSVDFLVASHSLEHVPDLVGILQEIYRVCRDRARLYIVAPYANQGLNTANPYHRQVFNEHAPRFWTDSRWSPVPPAEYEHPHASEWGLATSDNSLPRMDLRCVKMEFFYFPEYRNLPMDEQRAARKKYLDVCDQIVYHLIVAKQPMDEAEMQEIASRTDFYESPYVAIRRLQERLEAQASELVRATARISELEAQASELVRATARISELEAQASELVRATARISELEAEANELARSQRAARSMAVELDGLRRRKILRLLDRLPFRGDLREQVAPAFMRLRDDSYLFTRNLRGYRLQVGGNLQDVPFASYPLDLRRPGLRGILLAPTVDLPPSQGQLGIEIVTPQNEIILQVAAPAGEIDVSQPLQFEFAPMQGTSAGRYSLRVFARDVDVPIRLFEWRKYRLFGLGPLQTRAFCGCLFEA